MKLLDNPAPNSAENVLLKRTVSKSSLWKMELMEMSVVSLSHENAAQSSVKMLMPKIERIEVFDSKKNGRNIAKKPPATKTVQKQLVKRLPYKVATRTVAKNFGKYQIVILVGKKPYGNVARNSRKKSESRKIPCGVTRQNNNRTVMLTDTVRKIYQQKNLRIEMLCKKLLNRSPVQVTAKNRCSKNSFSTNSPEK